MVTITTPPTVSPPCHFLSQLHKRQEKQVPRPRHRPHATQDQRWAVSIQSPHKLHQGCAHALHLDPEGQVRLGGSQQVARVAADRATLRSAERRFIDTSGKAVAPIVGGLAAGAGEGEQGGAAVHASPGACGCPGSLNRRDEASASADRASTSTNQSMQYSSTACDSQEHVGKEHRDDGPAKVAMAQLEEVVVLGPARSQGSHKSGDRHARRAELPVSGHERGQARPQG